MTLKEPYMLAADQGDAYWSLGGLLVLKATGEQTGGECTVFDALVAPGAIAPFHIHQREDEAWYVLEGSITYYCGDQTIHAGPGSFVYGPRGVRHGFRVTGDRPVRALTVVTPAGFEGFIAEMGRPAPAMTPPPPEPPDMEKMFRLAKKYEIELLGPLPDDVGAEREHA